jgi:hypothetical protein
MERIWSLQSVRAALVNKCKRVFAAAIDFSIECGGKIKQTLLSRIAMMWLILLAD